MGLAAMVALVVGSSRASGTGQPLPLVGMNYSNFGGNGCGFADGIVAEGAWNPKLIRQQLAAMRAAGIQSLRTFIWNTHDAGGQGWGVVSSAGGRLSPAETTNLINFVSEVRSLGFTRLEVAFSPQGPNDPIGEPGTTYDPSLFDENWQLISYVRGIVKQYGPLDTRFDILNEGAPFSFLPTKTQLADYVARMYSNYVDTFGNTDVTVSANPPVNDQSDITNLIDTLRSTGRPLPTWFEMHIYSADPLGDLRAIDATLNAEGLSQPITVNETYYNDPSAASAVETFETTSSRPLDEVSAWPLRSGDTSNCFVPPPYRASAFITALTGSPQPHEVTVAVGPGRRLTLMTPYGQPVTALEAGKYTFAASDESRTDNFHITGPKVNVATGLRFRGARTWTLRLRPGTYHYRSDRTKSLLRGTFVVLTAG